MGSLLNEILLPNLLDLGFVGLFTTGSRPFDLILPDLEGIHVLLAHANLVALIE